MPRHTPRSTEAALPSRKDSLGSIDPVRQILEMLDQCVSDPSTPTAVSRKEMIGALVAATSYIGFLTSYLLNHWTDVSFFKTAVPWFFLVFFGVTLVWLVHMTWNLAKVVGNPNLLTSKRARLVVNQLESNPLLGQHELALELARDLVEHSKSAMVARLNKLSGAVDKIGVLPGLAALVGSVPAWVSATSSGSSDIFTFIISVAAMTYILAIVITMMATELGESSDLKIILINQALKEGSSTAR